MECFPTRLHAAKSQLVPGVLRVAGDPRVDSPKRIGDSTTRIRAQAADQNVAGALELALDRRVIQPSEPAMRPAVGCEIKASRAPLFDVGPAQMPEPVPGVARVPRVRLADIVRDHEGRSREAKVGEDGIGVLGQRGVRVVEGQ